MISLLWWINMTLNNMMNILCLGSNSGKLRRQEKAFDGIFLWSSSACIAKHTRCWGNLKACCRTTPIPTLLSQTISYKNIQGLMHSNHKTPVWWKAKIGYTGNLFGFVDLGGINSDFMWYTNSETDSECLFIIVRGLTSKLTFLYANYFGR